MIAPPPPLPVQPVTVVIPSALRRHIADALIDRAIELEADAASRIRGSNAIRALTARAAGLRDIADKVRP